VLSKSAIEVKIKLCRELFDTMLEIVKTSDYIQKVPDRYDSLTLHLGWLTCSAEYWNAELSKCVEREAKAQEVKQNETEKRELTDEEKVLFG
jgi:hypothetical protein